MDMREVMQAQNDADRVNALYQVFHEDQRLNRSNASSVEFLTNVHYIEKYLSKGSRILDIGAGAGAYSFYFARNGYHVTAVELAEANVTAFRKKLLPDDDIELIRGNALDLTWIPDNSFDIVLVFGPLYHLQSKEDQDKCVEEARRVCKPDGTIFFAFISNDMIILTEFAYDPRYFITGDYNKETFALNDFPFVFHTVDACRELLHNLTIVHQVASDGITELLAAKINEMDDVSFAQYLRYHHYICEKPEFLGMSNHLLFVCKP